MIQVTIAGRSYRMACGEGEEAHLEGVAAAFEAKIAELRGSFGEIGDMRLHVMAALTFVDELAETKKRLAAAEEELAALRGARRRRVVRRPRNPDGRRPQQDRRAPRAPGEDAERPGTGRGVAPLPEGEVEPQSGPGEGCTLSGGACAFSPRPAPSRPGSGEGFACPFRIRRAVATLRPAGLRGPSGDLFPGALSILKGAVPDPVPGPGHTAPTYVVGSRDRPPTTFAAPRSSPSWPILTPPRSRTASGRKPSGAATRSTRDFRRDAARAIAKRALELPELADIQPVGGYWPIRSEVDPRPLMRRLLKRGQDVALSQILHPRLSWRLWRPGDPLIKGGFGVREPGARCAGVLPGGAARPARRLRPKRRPRRLRQGPFRPLDRGVVRVHPVLTIGLAFAAQEIEAVPAEDHDRGLTWS